MADANHPYQCLVPYLDPNIPDSAVATSLKALPYRRNIFFLLGHSPGLFPPLMSVYSALFNGKTRTLPLYDWQLVVLRVSSVLDAQYEWEVNEPVARVHGMPLEKISAIRQTAPRFQGKQPDVPNEAKGSRPEVRSDEPAAMDGHGNSFTPRDRIILQIVDEQLFSYTNEAATIEQAKTLMSVEELVEVYIVLGVYTLIARITVGLRIDLDGEIPGLEESLKTVVSK